MRLNADLQRAGLVTSDRSGDTFKFQPGSVTRLEISRPSEDTDKLAITVGVGVPCGNDDVVYVYDYSQGPPQRVLESHGTRDHDESLSDVRFSKRDAMSSQLILTLRYGVQCGSSWNVLSYDLFRLSTTTNMAAPILGGEHGIWFGSDNPYQLRLEPDELLMELRDRSIDGGIHNPSSSEFWWIPYSNTFLRKNNVKLREAMRSYAKLRRLHLATSPCFDENTRLCRSRGKPHQQKP